MRLPDTVRVRWGPQDMPLVVGTSIGSRPYQLSMERVRPLWDWGDLGDTGPRGCCPLRAIKLPMPPLST